MNKRGAPPLAYFERVRRGGRATTGAGVGNQAITGSAEKRDPSGLSR